jgi:hypothetical protein
MRRDTSTDVRDGQLTHHGDRDEAENAIFVYIDQSSLTRSWRTSP